MARPANPEPEGRSDHPVLDLESGGRQGADPVVRVPPAAGQSGAGDATGRQQEEGDDGGEGDDARLRAYAEALADGIDAALGPWVQRCVIDLADAWQPGLARELADEARRAGARATAEVGPEVRRLLATDVDEQRGSPLAILRGAVRYPTEVLAAAGVPEVVRDDFAERAFPSDVYGLAPAAFADISPALHEPGLVWGAAKAHVVLARRRAEGKR